MDARNRFDRAALDRVAGGLRQHPGFAEARLAFCTGVTDWWLGVPINRALMSDTGMLMLHLAAAAGVEVAVPPAALAARYFVSASQITALLVEAERHAWLARLPGGSVRLTSVFADRVEVWVAREIAVVGMWILAKLTPPG